MEFIKKGSTGTAVTELQNILRELDYNIPVTGVKVAFHIRDGGHNLLLKDWNWFMDFADTIWKK